MSDVDTELRRVISGYYDCAGNEEQYLAGVFAQSDVRTVTRVLTEMLRSGD